MYEITLLIDPTREKKVENILTLCKAAGLEYTDDGVKTLCYPLTIDGREHLTAHNIYIAAPVAEPQALSDYLNRARWCLRYLIVKKGTLPFSQSTT